MKKEEYDPLALPTISEPIKEQEHTDLLIILAEAGRKIAGIHADKSTADLIQILKSENCMYEMKPSGNGLLAARTNVTKESSDDRRRAQRRN